MYLKMILFFDCRFLNNEILSDRTVFVGDFSTTPQLTNSRSVVTVFNKLSDEFSVAFWDHVLDG